MLEIKADVESASAEAVFCFTGSADKFLLSSPLKNGRMKKRLFYLPHPPESVTLSLRKCSRHNLSQLFFVPVPTWFARKRMLARVKRRVPHYRKISDRALWLKLKRYSRQIGATAIDLLKDRYDRTFMTSSVRSSDDYSEWIESVEINNHFDRAILCKQKRGLNQKIPISLIMIIQDGEELLLQESLRSLQAQCGSQWELIGLRGKTCPDVLWSFFQENAAYDERIRFFPNDDVHSVYAGIIQAQGEWVAIVGENDLLSAYALQSAAACIDSHPQVQVLYSDEDKIDLQGRRFAPLFKPDWNPDLFLSQGYTGSLTLVRRSIFFQCKSGITEIDANFHDSDLLINILDAIDADSIVHIPSVLYHRRVLKSDKKQNLKPDQSLQGLVARQHYFSKQNDSKISVEKGLVPESYRIRYSLPEQKPLVSLLIPTKDQFVLLSTCINSILQQTDYDNYEIVILDNGSSDLDTLSYLREIQRSESHIRVLPWPYSFNYSAINNYGAQHAKGSLLGLVNNDIEVISNGWLSEMVSHAVRKEIGCVGAKLYYPDRTIQHGGVVLGLGGVAGHSHRNFASTDPGYMNRLKLIQNYSAVTAACLVVEKDIYEAVGGLDEQNLKIAFNDVDFCLKVREQGYRNLWTPYAELIHHESKSRGLDDTPEKLELFRSEYGFMQKKWGDTLILDPMYSPCLSCADETFSLNLAG